MVSLVISNHIPGENMDTVPRVKHMLWFVLHLWQHCQCQWSVWCSNPAPVAQGTCPTLAMGQKFLCPWCKLVWGPGLAEKMFLRYFHSDHFPHRTDSPAHSADGREGYEEQQSFGITAEDLRSVKPRYANIRVHLKDGSNCSVCYLC